jgi:hypothetical protein
MNRTQHQKNQHTPGPWTSAQQDTGKVAIFSDCEYHQRICEMDDFTIGMGPMSEGKKTGDFGNRPTGTWGHEADTDRRAANARLIAAAPELLRACQSALAYLGEPPFSKRSKFKSNRLAALNIIQNAVKLTTPPKEDA